MFVKFEKVKFLCIRTINYFIKKLSVVGEWVRDRVECNYYCCAVLCMCEGATLGFLINGKGSEKVRQDQINYSLKRRLPIASTRKFHHFCKTKVSFRLQVERWKYKRFPQGTALKMLIKRLRRFTFFTHKYALNKCSFAPIIWLTLN